MKKILFYSLAILSIFGVLTKNAIAESHQNIPLRPCDFYGTEEIPNTLKQGSVITAQDSNGAVLGQFVITNDRRYGFLTCLPDDPNTPEDEGAAVGDIITFYIDGIKQQRQAVWKPGETVRLDLGEPAVEGGAFNLHLVNMPGYTNHEGNINYSGVAVSDMILDYLDPSNSDTQFDLMDFADQNKDSETSGLELERLLTEKAPSVYHFGSTSTIETYSERAYIGSFDAANQNDCMKQLCHWLSYKIQGAPAGKQYVPAAVATSSNPASNADSDYKHWMSLVGIKTNQDPFPNLPEGTALTEYYEVPETIELYGVYLNDPGQSGLGFHTYVTADVWTSNYFRPIATGLEEEDKYIAIMEPPDPKAPPITITAPKHNSNLRVILETPKTEISIYIPNWVNTKTQQYISSLLNSFKDSADFATLIDDTYFGEALKDTTVNRCYKIDGKKNSDYTIIPFEKKMNNRLATTVAAIVNNETGQFQIAAADLDANRIFTTMSYWKAYRALREKVGWTNEYPINSWLSNSVGSMLEPGWSVVTVKYDYEKIFTVLTTIEYTVTTDGEVIKETISPQIDVLGAWRFRSGKDWIKMFSLEVTDSEGYGAVIDQRGNCRDSYIWKNKNRCLVLLRGSKDSSCRIKVKNTGSNGNIQQGGITYFYVRK